MPSTIKFVAKVSLIQGKKINNLEYGSNGELVKEGKLVEIC